MDLERPLVSIYCLAYNHENYIRRCLDGFLNQKTDFPFEVIVHDDASSDNTAQIIREYEEKYPHIIRPIYQKENQYSLGSNPVRKFILPMVRGKYIAVCEGDDYWTEPDKLNSQIKLLEEHPDCHFSVCGVQEVALDETPLDVYHPNFDIQELIIPPESFIKYAAVYAFQTSSYVMRYEDWKDYILHPPRFRIVSDIGDLPMLLYFGSLGNTAYVKRVMSCYRRGAAASYSANKNKWPEDKRILHFEKQMNVWKNFDEFSEKRFHDVCVLKASQNMFGYLILQNKAKDYYSSGNREYFNALPVAKKVFVFMSCIFKTTMKKYYISLMVRREENETSVWTSVPQDS